MIYRFVQAWVDGGVLSHNPSPLGVYWSAYIEGGPEAVLLSRVRDLDYHTNGDSEWLAVRGALRYVVGWNCTQPVVIHSDSKNVVKQWHGENRFRIEAQRALAEECRTLAAALPWVAVKWVPREVIVAKVGH